MDAFRVVEIEPCLEPDRHILTDVHARRLGKLLLLLIVLIWLLSPIPELSILAGIAASSTVLGTVHPGAVLIVALILLLPLTVIGRRLGVEQRFRDRIQREVDTLDSDSRLAAAIQRLNGDSSKDG